MTAGVDMEMVSQFYREYGEQLVTEGKIPMATIDRSVRRVLRVKYRLGLFEHPYADEGLEKATLLSPANLAAARELAARTFVLLKNDHETLPLSRRLKSIAVIGPLADDAQEHDRPVERRWTQGGRGHSAGRHPRRTSNGRKSTMPRAATSPAIRARVLSGDECRPGNRILPSWRSVNRRT